MIRKFISDHRLKGFSVLAVLFCIGAYSVHYAQAHYNFSDLVGGGYSQAGCGTPAAGCHWLVASNNTSVSITTTAQQIVAGKTYIFQIVVKDTNHSHNQVAAGCDITVDNSTGALLDTNATTPPQGLAYFGSQGSFLINELAHLSPKSFGGTDSAVWTFKYTAPSQVGQYFIYAAGNAVNGDSAQWINSEQANPDTDQWGTITTLVNVVQSSSVSAETAAPANVQVYPNPSNGMFSITSQNELGAAEISVSDEAGKTVETQDVNLGSNNLDLTPLPSGTYFLHIKTTDGQSFLRRVVIKK